MENKYAYNTKISEIKFRYLLKLFSLDLTATQTMELSGLNRNTVNRIYVTIRQRMVECSYKLSPASGTIEVDESYFDPKRVKGKRGRGAGNKSIVFGLFKRNDKVYTEIVPAKHYTRTYQY